MNMKKLLLGAVALCLSIGAIAQELPQPSPAASLVKESALPILRWNTAVLRLEDVVFLEI